jgi:hypothetical protein
LCTEAEARRMMAQAAYAKVTSQFDLLTNVRSLGKVFAQYPKA